MAEAEINISNKNISARSAFGQNQLLLALLFATKRFRILFGLLVIPYLTLAQNKTALTADVVSSQYDKLLSAVPVYRLAGTRIVANRMQGQTQEKTYTVQLPAFENHGDTGYFFLYSGTALNAAVKGYVTVIAHHCCDNKPVELYVDHNGNLNFTDDGPALNWPVGEAEKKIRLYYPDDTLRTVHYRLSRFNFWGKEAYFNMLDDYYKREDNNRIFAGIRFSFRAQQLNCKGVHFVHERDSVTIGLLDANLNGLYNEQGIDHIICTGYYERILSFEQNADSRAQLVNKNNMLEYQGAMFSVDAIDPYGTHLSVNPVKHAPTKSRFSIGDRFPALKFKAWNSQKIKLRRIARNHPVYIHVVQFPYNEFQHDTALFARLLFRYPDLRIVWLQYGGRPNNVTIIAQLPNVTWYMGHTQLTLNRQMKIDRYPFGILLDKKRKVRAFQCSTIDLEPVLSELMKKK